MHPPDPNPPSSSLAGQMAALYSSHLVRYILPLVTIPYLARVLGVETLGLLAFVQAFGFLLVQFLEFGFGLAMTKEVAQQRDSPQDLARLALGVFLAQVLLAACALLISWGVAETVPALGGEPRLFTLVIVAAILMGANPLWFLRGIEQMKLVASLEVLVQLLRTVGIFLWVHHPDDVWLVPLADCIAAGLSTVLGLGAVLRAIPWRVPRWSWAWHALRLSWPLFIVRAASTLFSACSVLILGFLASNTVVGYYTGAEKIASAVRKLFNPAFDALYPQMSFRVRQNPRQAFAFMKSAFWKMQALAAIFTIGTLVTAPWAIRILLGPGFEGAVPALRILAFLSPFIVINLCFGSHWLLVLGYQRHFVTIGLITGGLNVLLTGLTAAAYPLYAHWGAAASFIVSQGVASWMFLALVRRVGLPNDAPSTSPTPRARP